MGYGNEHKDIACHKYGSKTKSRIEEQLLSILSLVRPLLLRTIQELRKEYLLGSGSEEKSWIDLLVDTYEIDLSLYIDYIDKSF